MTSMYVEDLQIGLLLKIDDRFYSEAELATQLATLLQEPARRKVDLATTDGAISIRYWGEELLGTAYWDEINLVVDGISCETLLQGAPVQTFLPMQSCWVRLHPRKDRLVYTLERVQPTHPLPVRPGVSPVHITAVLPLHQFIQQFELMRWRMIKLLAEFGSSSAMAMLSRWAEYVGPCTAGVVDTVLIRWIVEQSLARVLAQGNCVA